jgi:hypothetical protein
MLGSLWEAVQYWIGRETSMGPFLKRIFGVLIPRGPSFMIIPGIFNKGSSPNRVGGKGTERFSAQGVRPVHDGTESAGTTRIRERLLGFREAPVPDALSENRIPA